MIQFSYIIYWRNVAVYKADFNKILDASSFIISGAGKSGKMTFVFYLITSLFKKEALIFSAQESYLFRRKIDALASEYTQYSDIEKQIDTYFLKEDFKTLKQRYGFDFLIQEYEKLISSSVAEVVVIHRFGELFEFQDRYEIDNVYKSLIKICVKHSKKLIFVINNTHKNIDQIYNVAEEFSDISIRIDVDNNSERVIHVRDFLHNKEYPILSFTAQNNSFLLDYKKDKLKIEDKVNNVLICELNFAHDDITEICKFIFNKYGFHTKNASSLRTILQEVFVSPDIIIVLMKRTRENFETVQSIKQHLPNSPIVVILDQDFVRTEDEQQAYTYGVDELFCTNFALDKLTLAFQKVSDSLFYTKAIESLPKYPNIMTSMDDLRTYVHECIERSIYFSLFVYQIDGDPKVLQKPSRNYDFVFSNSKNIYYLALNTIPRDAKKIMEKFAQYKLVCIWEPINNIMVEECLK